MPRRVASAAVLLLVLAPTCQGTGPCDLNLDGQVSAIDVQLAVNQSLGVDACSSADVNSDGQCNVVDVQLLVNTVLGARCPAQFAGRAPARWVTGFTPKRVHYVDDVSCVGVGTIGDPECFSTAISTSHYQCGDLHILRAGAYHNSTTTITFSNDCTAATPAVFKGYVDANGQPEQATLNASIDVKGAWTWFVGLELLQNSQFVGIERSLLQALDSGVRVINSVAHDSRLRNNLGVWDDGPGQVIYGNVLYSAAAYDTTRPTGHNIYTQNNFDAHGWKYFVQNISLGKILSSSNLFQARGKIGRIDGIHLEANLFGDATTAVLFSKVGTDRSIKKIIYRNNYNFDHVTGSGRGFRCVDAPCQMEVTGNYLAKVSFNPESYWGNAGAHGPFIFTDNEIYDPPSGYHIRYFVTDGTSGSAGSHKLSNQDVWNNNTYGGTFKATLHCNGTDFGDLTMTQWRSSTDGCRETAGGTAFDASSKQVPNPKTNKIVVLQNEYQCPTCPFSDQDRGNIYIANWEGVSIDVVDISAVVGPNKRYVVRYARDFYGRPAASGICPGAGACNVNLPTRLAGGEAAGEFTNAYVITAEP